MTERCNAACSQCARNINGGEENPNLADRELDLESIKKIFPESFVKQLNHIYMCGNYGDPIVAQDTLEVLKYLRSVNNDILLTLNTNASARTKDWWAELAQTIRPNGFVVFSIDGLENTNHIYRKNTNWNKIIENAKSFIAAGGKAHWDFIVFEHNEHQVEEAREFALKLGFESFQVKKTARFFSHDEAKLRNHVTIVDKNGNKIELRLPKNPIYRNEGHKDIVWTEKKSIFPTITIPTTVKEVENNLTPELFNYPLVELLDKTEIDCKVKKEKSIFVSAEGIVQPCCWVATNMYSWFYMHKRTQIWKYINKVGLDKLNAKNYSIKEILDGNYFNTIEESWSKPSCKEGKLAICARTCGKNLETFSKQYT